MLMKWNVNKYGGSSIGLVEHEGNDLLLFWRVLYLKYYFLLICFGAINTNEHE